MDALTSLLTLLNTLSPLAVIALLGLVLLLQARSHKHTQSQNETLQTIKGNDLHDLPLIAETIRSMADTLQRIEVSQSENFSYLKARMNGKA